MKLEKVHLQRESHDRAACVLQPLLRAPPSYGSTGLERTPRLPETSWQPPGACCVLSTVASTLHLLSC